MLGSPYKIFLHRHLSLYLQDTFGKLYIDRFSELEYHENLHFLSGIKQNKNKSAQEYCSPAEMLPFREDSLMLD